MISNTASSAPVIFNSGFQSESEQANCQRIPKEYVRAARKAYQDKIEQERLVKRSLWQQIFGN